MSPATTTDTVGELAVRIPAASRVFARYDIDFCCGGGRALGEVCEQAGLDARAIVSEIEAEAPDPDEVHWENRPLDSLIDHLLDRYHAPLPGEFARLSGLVKKVHEVHGSKDPERLGRLVTVVEGLFAELGQHMLKEEQILFPWIRAGNGPNAGGPISVMHMEHDAAADALAEIRRLTDWFQPPEGACNSWQALWLGLKELDRELKVHIHLENNILFPRALAG